MFSFADSPVWLRQQANSESTSPVNGVPSNKHHSDSHHRQTTCGDLHMWRILEVAADDKAAPNSSGTFLDKDSEPHNYIFNYDQLDRSVEHIHRSQQSNSVIPTVSGQVQWSESQIACRQIDVHSLSTNDLNTDPLPFIDHMDSLSICNSTENLSQKVFPESAFRRPRSRSLTQIRSGSLCDLAHSQQSKHFRSATIDHRSSFS